MITINLIGIISFIKRAVATITIVSAVMAVIAGWVYASTENKIAYNIFIIGGYVVIAMAALAFIYMMVDLLYMMWTC